MGFAIIKLELFVYSLAFVEEWGEAMKLVTLMDNCAGENLGLKHEHGLSFYAQFPDAKVLFDFGPGPDTVENARKLDVPLENIQFAVGSHGHYDHGGGYPAFVEAGVRAPFVTGKGYFTEKYAVEDIRATYLGVGFDENFLEEKGILHKECSGVLPLSPSVSVMTGFRRSHSFETIPERFRLRQGEEWKPDLFDDEICLVHQLKEGLFVLVGCSHPGILNILSSVEEQYRQPIIGVAGGTHLMEASEARIGETLVQMKKFGMKLIGFNHCTGETFRERVRKEPDLHAMYLGAGDTLFLE